MAHAHHQCLLVGILDCASCRGNHRHTVPLVVAGTCSNVLCRFRLVDIGVDLFRCSWMMITLLYRCTLVVYVLNLVVSGRSLVDAPTNFEGRLLRLPCLILNFLDLHRVFFILTCRLVDRIGLLSHLEQVC